MAPPSPRPIQTARADVAQRAVVATAFGAVAEHTVTLAPGETAHTVVQITDVGNFSRSQCAPVTAFGLKVIPPDETTSAGVPFNFRACSKPGPIFLTVQPVQKGVGVPGYPNL